MAAYCPGVKWDVKNLRVGRAELVDFLRVMKEKQFDEEDGITMNRHLERHHFFLDWQSNWKDLVAVASKFILTSKHVAACKHFFFQLSYFWWLKSWTTWDFVQNLMNYQYLQKWSRNWSINQQGLSPSLCFPKEVGSIQHCRRWPTTGLQATWHWWWNMVVFQCESGGFFPIRGLIHIIQNHP